jgi:tetratricopeptide (TPR) repeat protein
MRPAHLRILVGVLALSLIHATASAKEDPDTEIARRHYDRGTQLYDAGQYREAVKEFEAANTLRPSPAFDYNMARCYDRLEEIAAAIAAYERYLAASATPGEDDEVRQRIVVLRQRLKPVRTSEPAAPAPAPSTAPLKIPSLSVTTRPESSGRRLSIAVPATFLALTVASFASAGALYAVSGQQYDDLVASGCGRTIACGGDRYGGTQMMEQAGIGLFIAGGVVAAVDVVLWAVWAKRRGGR